MQIAGTERRKIERGASVLDAIYGRRSARHFQSNPVPASIVRELLDAAIQAPSTFNSQPWAFVVVQRKSLLRELSACAIELENMAGTFGGEYLEGSQYSEDAGIFYGATTLIIVCAKRDGLEPLADCYLAGQNLMLAAYAMGLATCPIGVARPALQSDLFKRRLSIPNDFVPALPVAVGYPGSGEPVPPRHPVRIFSWTIENEA
jgi:nitroreductase